MEKAAALYGAGGRLERTPCIFAVGNAPTALIRLYELVQESKLRPALIIAMSVGFVNVVQSKELILSLKKTPFIVARGRKGGSNIAAAVCNACLLYTSTGRRLCRMAREAEQVWRVTCGIGQRIK